MEHGLLLLPGCWPVPESCPGDVIIIIRLDLQPLLDHKVLGTVAPGKAQTSSHLPAASTEAAASGPVLGFVALCHPHPATVAPLAPLLPTHGPGSSHHCRRIT